jgi:hypothetical protein
MLDLRSHLRLIQNRCLIQHLGLRPNLLLVKRRSRYLNHYLRLGLSCRRLRHYRSQSPRLGLKQSLLPEKKHYLSHYLNQRLGLRQSHLLKRLHYLNRYPNLKPVPRPLPQRSIPTRTHHPGQKPSLPQKPMHFHYLRLDRLRCLRYPQKRSQSPSHCPSLRPLKAPLERLWEVL